MSSFLRSSAARTLALSLLAIGASIACGVFLWSTLGGLDPLILRLQGEDLTFSRPRAFVLLAALPLLLLAQRWSLADLHPAQQVLAFLMRAALIGALAGALAQPGVDTEQTTPCVVHLIDRSLSMTDEMISEGVEDANASWRALGGQYVYMVAFDGEAEIIAADAEDGGWTTPPRSDDPQTGLVSAPGSALRAAAGLCPVQTTPSFVLHSDGNATRDSGRELIAQYAARGAVVHTALPEAEAPDEVLIERVTFPDRVLADEPFRATVTIRARREGMAHLEMQRPGLRPERREIALRAGGQDVAWTMEISEPGRHDVWFSLQPSGPDRFEENNEWQSALQVEGRPRVLYVEGVSRSRSYLARALDRRRNASANFDLEVRSATGMPYALEEMRNYEAIILSDVPSRYVSRRAMQNLHSYVRDHGGGLILVGGEDAFGPGGYQGTTLEDLSPVRFTLERERNLPSLAMMLVIDRSGSMAGTNIEMARAAATASIEMLGPQDYVGVIAFDDQPQNTIRLQSAASRARLIDEVSRISPAGGTAIYPALEEAFLQLAVQPARIKHVILLTDGQAPWEGIAELVESMRSESISVSSVAVGAGADRALLEMIAELGDGRFYATQDPRDVPQIFIRETAEVARTSFVEEPIRAVVNRSHPLLRGVDIAGAPYLLGYVSTRPRREATTVLTSESGDPLLATWQQGAGRVTVFTSDAKNRWSVEWVRHPVYQQLWTNIVRQTMRYHEERTFDVHVAHRDEGVELYSDAIDDNDRFINQLDVRATLRRGDERVTAALTQRAPGRYAHFFDSLERGVWSWEVTWAEPDGTVIARDDGSFNRPYPSELLEWTHDEALMVELAQLGGGMLNPDTARIIAPEGRSHRVREERWPRWLMLALVLLAIDVFLRRIRVGRPRARSWADVIGT